MCNCLIFIEWRKAYYKESNLLSVGIFRSIQQGIEVCEPSVGSTSWNSRGLRGLVFIIILILFPVLAIWERGLLCQDLKAEDGFKVLHTIFAIHCWCWVNLWGPFCHSILDILALIHSSSIFPACSFSSLFLLPYLLLASSNSPTVGWWKTCLYLA